MSVKKSRGIYKALITQSGIGSPAGDPVAIVLENTLLPGGADISWAYTGIGDYLGTLVGAFEAGKTIGVLQSPVGGIAFVETDRGITTDSVQIISRDDLNNNSDDQLSGATIIIEVFE